MLSLGLQDKKPDLGGLGLGVLALALGLAWAGGFYVIQPNIVKFAFRIV